MVDTNQENIVLSFLRFLRKPNHDIEITKKKNPIDFLNIFILIALGIIINTALTTLNVQLLKWTNYDFGGNFSGGMDGFVWWYFFLITIIIAPIREELTYRLGLKFSIYNFSFALSFLLVILLYWTQVLFIKPTSDFYYIVQAITMPFDHIDYLALIVLVLILGFIISMILKKFFNEEKMKNLFSRRFTYIFYFFAIIFALSHLTNFENLGQIWFIIPILLLPQIVGALILGYIRMRWGLKYAILSHIANNFLNSYILLF
jgi:membrane protease YdiL (CAAX protease family)